METQNPSLGVSHGALELSEPCAMTGLSEYVPVVFAQDGSLASLMSDVLECYGITTLVESGEDDADSLGIRPRRVPVLVPEEMIDEASEIVAELEDQLKAGFDDDGDEDLDDDDLFDDDELDEGFDEAEEEDDDFYEDDEEDEF